MATKARARTWKRWAVVNHRGQIGDIFEGRSGARLEIACLRLVWPSGAPHTAIPVLVTEILPAPKKRGKK